MLPITPSSAVQKHKLIAFRRVAAMLYKKNLKWKKAVNMATKDSLFVDAMETAAQSGSRELIAELLKFFVVEAKDQHSFAACLFTCQGLVGFHTALEMAWLHQEQLPGILSLCMPFFVACIREYTGKVCTSVYHFIAMPREVWVRPCQGRGPTEVACSVCNQFHPAARQAPPSAPRCWIRA
jgi:hypothetical protein